MFFRWVLLLLLMGPAWTQLSNTTLSGMVVTGATENVVGHGAPLAGVEIEVLGTSRLATSDANGYFAFRDLPDGDYLLACRKEGFQLTQMRVRVRFAGLASHCQILMQQGPRSSGSDAIYVAYSKKHDGTLRRESSPYELLAQKILAAGGKLPGLQPEYVGLPGSLTHPLCSGDNYLMVYPPQRPSQATFLELPGEPHWLAFEPRGQFLYVAAREIPMLQIYAAGQGHALVRNIPIAGCITELSLSRDGRILLVGVMGTKSGVTIVDISTNLPIAHFPTSSPPWSILAVGQRLFACSGDSRSGHIVALDLQSGQLIGQCQVGHQPTGLAATPDGRTLVVACSGNACISLVDTLEVKELGRISVGVEPKKVAISPDGATCAVTNFVSNSLSLIDLNSKAVKATVELGQQPLAVAYEPSGRKLYVTCNRGGSLAILDAASGTLLHSTLPMPHSVPWGLCIRP